MTAEGIEKATVLLTQIHKFVREIVENPSRLKPMTKKSRGKNRGILLPRRLRKAKTLVT
jgi:hypothetical protein